MSNENENKNQFPVMGRVQFGNQHQDQFKGDPNYWAKLGFPSYGIPTTDQTVLRELAEIKGLLRELLETLKPQPVNMKQYCCYVENANVCHKWAIETDRDGIPHCGGHPLMEPKPDAPHR